MLSRPFRRVGVTAYYRIFSVEKSAVKLRGPNLEKPLARRRPENCSNCGETERSLEERSQQTGHAFGEMLDRRAFR